MFCRMFLSLNEPSELFWALTAGGLFSAAAGVAAAADVQIFPNKVFRFSDSTMLILLQQISNFLIRSFLIRSFSVLHLHASSLKRLHPMEF